MGSRAMIPWPACRLSRQPDQSGQTCRRSNGDGAVTPIPGTRSDAQDTLMYKRLIRELEGAAQYLRQIYGAERLIGLVFAPEV